MKKNLLCFLMVSCLCVKAQSQTAIKELVEQNFQLAAQQYKLLQRNTPADKMPRTFNAGKWSASGIDWWTSGFFPGSLWLIYEATGDKELKAFAEERLHLLQSMQRFTGNHDIGFMIFCSFGTAYRITGNTAYKQVIDTAAFWQITRYRPSIKAIQSWNKSQRFECPVIIDNMMNLEQLCWVSSKSGNKKYSDIAVEHANTTKQNHFRKDYSSYHVVDYDLNSGSVIKKVTAQGLADSSAWARGQAWGLYGYTMMYRFTKNKKYLQQAKRIASFLLNHPNLPADKVPYWDFNAAPGSGTLRDASAAAITCSALLELAQYSKKKSRKAFVSTAEEIIRSLSSDQYRAKPGENGGFLLMHSVGSLPANAEVDVPLTYADYYFLESLKRYKDWYL